jgi:hypothetical protein
VNPLNNLRSGKAIGGKVEEDAPVVSRLSGPEKRTLVGKEQKGTAQLAILPNGKIIANEIVEPLQGATPPTSRNCKVGQTPIPITDQGDLEIRVAPHSWNG